MQTLSEQAIAAMKARRFMEAGWLRLRDNTHHKQIPVRCASCGSSNVETTLLGTALAGPGPHLDDANRATCLACGHRGTVGDWQRIVLLVEDIGRREPVFAP